MPTSPSSPEVLARHVVLVGMMGAGKTTVGSRLARRLQVAFVDTDHEVERRTGRSVREIFAEDGEAAFRGVESAVLAAALAAPTPSVIAAAGGTVLDPGNRRRMRDLAQVIFLDARPGALASRVGGGRDHRPLLGDDPASALRRIDEQRRPLYLEVAEHTVDVDEMGGPDEVAERVFGLVTAPLVAG